MKEFLLFLAPIKEEKAMYGAMPDVWDCKIVRKTDNRWKAEIKIWCKQRGVQPSQLMVKELEFKGFHLYNEEDFT